MRVSWLSFPQSTRECQYSLTKGLATDVLLSSSFHGYLSKLNSVPGQHHIMSGGQDITQPSTPFLHLLHSFCFPSPTPQSLGRGDVTITFLWVLGNLAAISLVSSSLAHYKSPRQQLQATVKCSPTTKASISTLGVSTKVWKANWRVHHVHLTKQKAVASPLGPMTFYTRRFFICNRTGCELPPMERALNLIRKLLVVPKIVHEAIAPAGTACVACW